MSWPAFFAFPNGDMAQAYNASRQSLQDTWADRVDFPVGCPRLPFRVYASAGMCPISSVFAPASKRTFVFSLPQVLSVPLSAPAAWRVARTPLPFFPPHARFSDGKSPGQQSRPQNFFCKNGRNRCPSEVKLLSSQERGPERIVRDCLTNGEFADRRISSPVANALVCRMMGSHPVPSDSNQSPSRFFRHSR